MANYKQLVTRLRDLESEAIRLATSELPPERTEAKKVYEKRLNQLESSHSGSWFGDHSSTYYGSFDPPPPGHSFDVEWGFIPGFGGSRNPGWNIYSRDQIRGFVFQDIGEEIYYETNNLAADLNAKFSDLRDQALDVLEALATAIKSKALDRYKARIESELLPFPYSDFVNQRLQSAPRMTRDSEEISKGRFAPAHIQYLSPLQSINVNKARLKTFASVIRNVIEATNLFDSEPMPNNASGKKIFIGHGKSELWRVLKDFISERLGLSFEEFNRVSSAGISTQERLSEMLNGCEFGFLVLAGEDLHGDGSLHARENVIHEAGLFQGRLGWRKAIILLEDGCEEFSNIVGLGQIRFPKGNIAACFEEIRRVLEREEILRK
jgi:predicted nucleotide-binding protein